jgi:hypothetical protein
MDMRTKPRKQNELQTIVPLINLLIFFIIAISLILN